MRSIGFFMMNPKTERRFNDLIGFMLALAVDYIENYEPHQLEYMRSHRGFEGPTPIQFHLESGDKFILRNILINAVKREIPKKWWRNPRDSESRSVAAQGWAYQILFNEYYPNYEWANRTFSD